MCILLIKMTEQHCTYSKVLSPDETEFIKQLFRSTGKKCPETRKIACIDAAKQTGPQNCQFRYEFGYNVYCSNEQRITREERKTIH
jgi:hypothetical protein